MPDRPVRVAVVGGGCASIAAAFELSRPEHAGRYQVTVYQLGWRLGGKGASGRGPADRIEEHGLHVWLGFYENAFRLLRECYKELDRAPRRHRFASWRDAFYPDPWVGVADRSPQGEWLRLGAQFPTAPGTPGDPVSVGVPSTVAGYVGHCAELVWALLAAIQRHQTPGAPPGCAAMEAETPEGSDPLAGLDRLARLGRLASQAGVVEAARLLAAGSRWLPGAPRDALLRSLDTLGASARRVLEADVERDDELRRLWSIADLVLAILRGCVRYGLLTDPRGFDAINDFECLDWLRRNGASETSLASPIVRGLYGLAFAYEDGDTARPALAAGQAIRGALRMFFTYRGSLFWKMRAGMGDTVFAPFYEVLKRRGVRFEFFHRLENVAVGESGSGGEGSHVEALEFDIEARTIGGGEYQPLIDVRGVACWPAVPALGQLEDGERFAREGWEFESHWDRRCVGKKTLRVGADFDCVVLGIPVATLPYACRDLVARDPRWRAMVEHVKTVATQAFQLWLREDLETLGWEGPQSTFSGFEPPFDTWADMRQLVSEESFAEPPKAVAYFCGALPTPPELPSREQDAYPREAHDAVRARALQFLDEHIGALWPGAVSESGGFRWDLLVDPTPGDPTDLPADEKRFDTQYWRANVNPSDRYVLCVPGSVQYRISPLDRSYDNLCVAGDWTACGFTEGCVEAAVMSGRLAAHAIAGLPRLGDIVGYDHP